MFDNIEIRAGARALAMLRDGGFNPGRVRTIAGASGGPKWLVLAGMDRILPAMFAQRKRPLSLVGSSIGAWRMAALASRDPYLAMRIFEERYVNQRYARRPTAAEVTAESARIMDAYLAGNEAGVLGHPVMRLSVITVRAKGLGASDARLPLWAGLAFAALGNFASRSLLRFSYERAIFSDPREAPPFLPMSDFPPRHIPLTELNIRDAIMASGSIPLVMSGVRGIAGAPEGTYRDGGIIDYHLDMPFAAGPDEFILYPHFYDRIIPGWFDKSHPGRRPRAEHMANVVLVAPSKSFVDALPGRKIPDRDDFFLYRGRDDERIACWKKVALMSRRIADEFMQAVEGGRIRELAKPIECR